MKGDNMLVINVIFKIKNGSREDFLKIVREEGIDVASRNEEGNYKYDFFFSMEDPEDIFPELSPRTYIRLLRKGHGRGSL